MKTDLYLHYGKSICAIVSVEQGYKFIDNIESFCPTWTFLIEEAKTGFDGFLFTIDIKIAMLIFWSSILILLKERMVITHF